MAQVRIPVGSGGVKRIKGAVAKATGAKSKAKKAKPTFVGKSSGAKKRGG